MPSRQHMHSVVSSLQPIIVGVREDQLTKPTPCPDFKVRDLANHLLGTSEAMRRAGAGEDPDPADPWGTEGDHMSSTWRKDLGDRLIGWANAWSQEDAWEGEAHGMPKRGLGDMSLIEVMVHGWDLARATGQEVNYSDGATARAREVMEEIGAMGRDQGAFGPAVELPDDASDFERALGESGRDPQWKA